MDRIKPDFGIICRHKDTNSSNLSSVFDSYGCNTLEAKVAVVEDATVDQLCKADADQQLYGTLMLKTASANRALMGRGSRTKNRELKMVEISGETVLAAGPIRERSPVNGDELNDELDEYMKEAARIKEMKRNGDFPIQDAMSPLVETPTKVPPLTNRSRIMKMEVVKAEDNEQDLDDDLEKYMSEVARIKAQKKRMVEQTDRALAMEAIEAMEADSDDDL